jgi:Sulfotransferase family
VSTERGSVTADAAALDATVVADRRLPDFFIVCHAKCGTTALYDMLRQHPRIYMPDNKEPWFFARNNPHPQTSGERSIAFTGRRTETLEEYLRLFREARGDQLIGEASTSYLWSAVAPRAIAEAQPSARIIALFREPASYLRSMHLQLVANRAETETDFRKAVELDDARREGKRIPKNAYWPQTLIYSDRVRYVEQLRRYHALFPRKQVLVLIYEDFRRDNAATVRQVLRFLELDDSSPLDVLEANPTIDVRSVKLDSFTRTIFAGNGLLSGAVKSTIKALTSRRLREDLIYPMRRRLVYRYPGPPDERFMRELRRRFRPEVEGFGEYLGRDLVSLWGYDDLD